MHKVTAAEHRSADTSEVPISCKTINRAWRPYTVGDNSADGGKIEVAVVASWLGQSSSGGASTRDAPGTYEAKYSPVAVDDDAVVATGTSRYREVPDGPIVRTYENCFIMRFDGEGRCREFTEYYLRRP